MGFNPCKSDPCVWMREQDDHWEYICVYVDDLMVCMKKPQQFFDDLTDVYKYKLKGVRPPSYNLGGMFERNKDGTLSWGVK